MDRHENFGRQKGCNLSNGGGGGGGEMSIALGLICAHCFG